MNEIVKKWKKAIARCDRPYQIAELVPVAVGAGEEAEFSLAKWERNRPTGRHVWRPDIGEWSTRWTLGAGTYTCALCFKHHNCADCPMVAIGEGCISPGSAYLEAWGEKGDKTRLVEALRKIVKEKENGKEETDSNV